MTTVKRATPNWLKKIESRWLNLNNNKGNRAVSLYISGTAVATVVGRNSPKSSSGQGYEIAVRADPVASPDGYAEAVEKQADSLRLRKDACHIILAPEFYNLTLVDRPPVPEEDLKEAVRWAVQDNIDFPMEHAELDYFDLPASASKASNRDLLFVSVIKKELLSRLLGYIEKSELQPKSVGISELSFRNTMATAFPEIDRSIGLLRLTKNSGLINISRASELFLSRRVSGIPTDFTEEAWSVFKDQLLLQVQRSIDYYESAMAQPPCDALVIAVAHNWQDRVCDYLDEMLPMPIMSSSSVLEPHFDVTLHNPEPSKLDWKDIDETAASAISAALPAIGGMLRGLKNNGSSESH